MHFRIDSPSLASLQRPALEVPADIPALPVDQSRPMRRQLVGLQSSQPEPSCHIEEVVSSDIAPDAPHQAASLHAEHQFVGCQAAHSQTATAGVHAALAHNACKDTSHPLHSRGHS